MNKQKEVTPKELIQFIGKISKIDPVDFAGLLKIFCVTMWKQDSKTPKNLDELLSELIDVYVRLGYKQRKEINKMVDAVLRSNTGENHNGNSKKG